MIYNSLEDSFFFKNHVKVVWFVWKKFLNFWVNTMNLLQTRRADEAALAALSIEFEQEMQQSEKTAAETPAQMPKTSRRKLPFGEGPSHHEVRKISFLHSPLPSLFNF